jgi:hypothetical protein
LLVVGGGEEFGHGVAGLWMGFDDEAVAVDAEAYRFAYTQVEKVEDGRRYG